MTSRYTLGPLLLALFVLVADACGGSTERPAPCKPGEIKACATANCTRVCLADGTFSSECACFHPGSGGLSGFGGSTGGSDAGPSACASPGGFGGSSGFSGYGGCGACPSYTLQGNIPLPSCCTADAACGVWIDSKTTTCLDLQPGCYAPEPAGAPDTSCGSIGGGNVWFQGCCRNDTGACGFAVDYSAIGGPSLGCTDFFGYGGGGPQKCTTGDPCAVCKQVHCWAQNKTCLTTPDCQSFLDCIASCSATACVENCVSSHPNAKAPYDTLTLCLKDQCATSCP